MCKFLPFLELMTDRLTKRPNWPPDGRKGKLHSQSLWIMASLKAKGFSIIHFSTFSSFPPSLPFFLLFLPTIVPFFTILNKLNLEVKDNVNLLRTFYLSIYPLL